MISKKDRPSATDDEIDVRQLLHTLWLQRKVIILMALVSAAVGLGVAQLSTKYVSEAVLQLPQKKVTSRQLSISHHFGGQLQALRKCAADRCQSG